jgi:nitrate/nitrite transporter NarK
LVHRAHDERLVGLLFLVGVVVVYWKWAVAIVVVVLAVMAASIAWRELQGERSAERARRRGLIARADQQHLWAMSGDPRGVHGNYPPALRGEPF